MPPPVPVPASEPDFFFVELWVLDFFVVLPVVPVADFLVAVCELLADVVVAVSVVFVQEATNATPASAITVARRDFFIGRA